jgi:predicted RNA-binding Zn-ribbon protein involved in translation (DUF1610 family)
MIMPRPSNRFRCEECGFEFDAAPDLVAVRAEEHRFSCCARCGAAVDTPYFRCMTNITALDRRPSPLLTVKS